MNNCENIMIDWCRINTYILLLKPMNRKKVELMNDYSAACLRG